MRLRRRKKLIQPGLQLRLVGSILGIALLGMLLQFLAIHRGLVAEAASIPGAGGVLADRVPGVTVKALVGSVLIVVPLLSIVGVLTTFRLAGPLYRFEIFLRAVKAGRQTEPCRLRKGDELMELCELLNDVTERARSEARDELEDAEVEAEEAAEQPEAGEAA